jgi:hypothetical protein
MFPSNAANTPIYSVRLCNLTVTVLPKTYLKKSADVLFSTLILIFMKTKNINQLKLNALTTQPVYDPKKYTH